MKKILVGFMLLISIVLFSMSSSGLTYHFTDNNSLKTMGTFSPRLSGGISTVYYYINNYSTMSQYASDLISGIESWNSNSAINFTQTTVYWNSVCDVKVYDCDLLPAQIYNPDVNKIVNNPFKTCYAYAKLWYGGGPGASNNKGYEFVSELPATGDYWLGEIFINYKVLPSSNSSMKKQVAAHEAGHVLGLNHINLLSIMNDPLTTSSPATPTNTDKNNVYDLYYARW